VLVQVQHGCWPDRGRQCEKNATSSRETRCCTAGLSFRSPPGRSASPTLLTVPVFLMHPGTGGRMRVANRAERQVHAGVRSHMALVRPLPRRPWCWCVVTGRPRTSRGSPAEQRQRRWLPTLLAGRRARCATVAWSILVAGRERRVYVVLQAGFPGVRYIERLPIRRRGQEEVE